MIPKFRGRCPDGGWIHGSCVKFDDNTCFIMPEFGGASTLSYAQLFNHTAQYVDIETVGLSTGLKDKNGIEIFEGDIVLENGMQRTVSFGEQEYEEDFGNLAYYIGFNVYTKWGYATLSPVEYEVLGNIYENPELLEVEG